MNIFLAFISLLSFGTPLQPANVVYPNPVIVSTGSGSASGLNYVYTNWAWATSGFTNTGSSVVNSNYTSVSGYTTIVSYPVGISNSFVSSYAPGTLSNDLFTNVTALATNISRTWSYNPNSPNLGTNQSVWTWPVNLSCLGYASDGFQSVLIARNELLVCGHYGGESGKTVLFFDTNGVSWTAVVTNVLGIIADMEIAQLSNSAPAAIVIPYVLPPNYTNYLAGHSIVGLPCFWCQKNSGILQYSKISSLVDNSTSYGYGTWMTVFHAGTGPFGNGSGATGGDSGSPAFMIWTNNVPILLFATTFGMGGADGMFISGQTNWSSLASSPVGTNGLNILSLSGYSVL